MGIAPTENQHLSTAHKVAGPKAPEIAPVSAGPKLHSMVGFQRRFSGILSGKLLPRDPGCEIEWRTLASPMQPGPLKSKGGYPEMSALILVHGIDNEQLTPDGVEAEWVPALAGGVRLAGRPDIADRLWPPRSRHDAITCRAAYYGDLFRPHDQQGCTTDLRDLRPIKRLLPRHWPWSGSNGSPSRPASSVDGAQARFALNLARDSDQNEVQGIGNIQRQIIKTLAGNSWLAQAVMFLAERFVFRALIQVTRYLSDEMIRALAQQRVLNLVEDDTRIIIGHSLGSVVAYESAHRLAQPLPLLVTLGSPLGLRTIVTDRLCPPLSYPPTVDRWVNVADREDFIAAELDLGPNLACGTPGSSRFEPVMADNGSAPHSAVHYLGRIAVGKALSEVLTGL